jgi:Peptidase family M48
LNVVEEMSIASGVPMPQVYVLDSEHGINAFAAGTSTEDAVVAVTRGTLDTLNRDELQGVIAHEFSHILNGDMRLNVRIMGVVFGILALTIIGRILIRVRGSSKKGGAIIPLMGLAFILIGYFGTMIGRMIQSAVSRQREYLADSSAVQFTRNPEGIGGALKKIGGLTDGSLLTSPKAEQAGHFFFGQGTKVSLFSRMLATHPPLIERITRIDPAFAGEFAETVAIAASSAAPPLAASGFAGSADQPIPMGIVVDPDEVIGHVGNPTEEHVAFGAELLAAIPDEIHETLFAPETAPLVVYSVLLDEDPTEREGQLKALRDKLEHKQIEWLVEHYPQFSKLDRRFRLPLVDLSTTALNRLESDNKLQIVSNMMTLITADSKVTLFEFSIQRLLLHRLMRSGKKPPKVVYKGLKPIMNEVADLLAGLAFAGQPDDPDQARQAFEAGMEHIPKPGNVKPHYDEEAAQSLGKVGEALDKLALAGLGVKERVIDACAHCAFHDREVTVEEAELLRVISSILGCPLPPFLPR